MGMDLTVYRLVRPLTNEEYATTDLPARLLLLRAAQVEHFQVRHPGATPVQDQLLDIDKVRNDHGLDDAWAPVRWDVSKEQGWVAFERGSEPQRLVEVDSLRYTTLDPLYTQAMEVAEVAYMRKPFRNGSTAPRMEGDTLILPTDNFTGCDMARLAPLLGEDAMRDSYGCYFYEDLERLQQLEKHCHSPQQWRRQVLDKLTADCVVVIDW